MWSSLENQNFICKKDVRDDCFCVFVSDFKSVWYKFLSDDELLSTSLKLNPLFEAPLQKLKEITLNLFDDEKSIRKIKENENQTIQLKLQSVKMNIKFQFQITLIKGNEELLYNEIIFPLLLILIQMQRRERKLIKIINEKDSEIEEWKQMNGYIAKGLVKTKPFIEKDFRDEDASSPTVANVKWQPTELLDCINSNLNFLQNNLTSIDKKSENAPNPNCVVITQASTSLSNGLKQCISINHEIIKKRKKENQIF